VWFDRCLLHPPPLVWIERRLFEAAFFFSSALEDAIDKGALLALTSPAFQKGQTRA